jgi:hypothetical protein
MEWSWYAGTWGNIVFEFQITCVAMERGWEPSLRKFMVACGVAPPWKSELHTSLNMPLLRLSMTRLTNYVLWWMRLFHPLPQQHNRLRDGYI